MTVGINENLRCINPQVYFSLFYIFDRIKRVLCLRMETPGVAGKGDGGQGQTGARDASRLEP